MIRLAALLIVCAAGQESAPPAAQPISRPRSAERVVRAFDFDERGTNPFPVPRYWRRAQGAAASPFARERPGFPLWNQAVLDYPAGGSAEGAVKLPTNGGSVCLRLDSGMVAVFPDAEYRVTARVRTAGLSHARARVVARFLDKANTPIEASEVRGELIGDQPEWCIAAVELTSEHAGAAFIQVDLELLQPEQFALPDLGRHHVWLEDFSGAAWFDDVTITQLPRIELGTGTSTNVVTAPERPSIHAVVRDLSGEPIRARITLYDLDGRVVDRVERPVRAGEPRVEWVPAVIAYGWYRAALEVLAPSGLVGLASVDLVWLPEASGSTASADRSRLGIAVERVEPAWIPGTLDLLAALRVGAASVPAWSDRTTIASVSGEAVHLGPLIDGLRRRGVLITFSLPRVPAPLAAAMRLDPNDTRGVFGGDPAAWTPYLLPFLDKYGQSVQHWQLGVHAPPGPQASLDARGVDAARRFLASLVPGPVVTIPWAPEVAVSAGVFAGPGGPDGLAMVVDHSTPDEAVGRLAADWMQHRPERGLELTLGTLPAGLYSWRDVSIDLSRRAVLFWAACSGSGGALPGASIVQPWTWTQDRIPRPMPAPIYAVWSNIADRLAGRRFAGEVPLAPGVRCILMAPEDGAGTGLLVAWRESAPPDQAAIRAILGTDQIIVYDLFGNATRVPAVHEGTAMHYIPVTDTPVFVEGVDVALARWVASLRLEPAFFASGAGPYEAEVILSNPWPEPVAGRLHIVEPGGSKDARPDRSWQIEPRRIDFAAGPGQTLRLPIRLAFSTVEEAGIKPFVVDAELDGREEYGLVRMLSSLEVGLGSLRLDLSYRFGGSGAADLILEAQVSNSGTSPVTLELTAFAPPDSAYPRARASISDLGPGETVVRRFAFPGGVTALRGRSVLVSVQDTGADARINRSVTVE